MEKITGAVGRSRTARVDALLDPGGLGESSGRSSPAHAAVSGRS
jgi:hypothetical protein